MEKNRKKQIVVLSIALVCIFILVFSLFHKSATKDSANPPLTNVLTDSISQIVAVSTCKCTARKVKEYFRKNTQKGYENLIFLLGDGLFCQQLW